MAKNETEKEVEMTNGTRERKEYEITSQAKDKKFEVSVFTRKFKNSSNTTTLIIIDINGYKKECRLENDERGFVIMNGTHQKYPAVFCEGVNQDGVAYLGIDIWLDKDYNKREWFTRLEKIMLAKQGLLREVK